MAKRFQEEVEVLDDGGRTVIELDANRGTIASGGEGKLGNLRLEDRDGRETVTIDARGSLELGKGDSTMAVEIDGQNGSIEVRNAQGRRVFRFLGSRGTLDLGSAEGAGQVLLRRDGKATIHLHGGRGELEAGAEGQSGAVRLVDSDGDTAIELEAGAATVTLGREGSGGNLKLIDETGGLAFHVTGNFARMRGALILGGRDEKGDLALMDQTGRPAIVADAGSAQLQLGNRGNAGDLRLLDNDAEPILKVDGLTATLEIGGNGKPGYIVLRDGDDNETGRLSAKGASLHLGSGDRGGEILLLDGSGRASFSVDGKNATVVVGRGEQRIVLDGGIGDIRLPGADCAEEFETVAGSAIEPGTVLVVANEEELHPSTRAYDPRVAGVVSGAGGIRPGIVLNRGLGGKDRSRVALNGKVYCKVDASPAAIAIGDLLTTSDLEGHAMKAIDRDRAFGAVIGKALAPQAEGQGLIPILVSLL